jgi:predicted metal-dependent TIM-barrel fold hydrolase
LGTYLDHGRCVAIGEIGFNNMTPNEEHAFERQLALARERDMLVIVHLPHINKLEGAQRTLALLKRFEMPHDSVVIDHNTEETIALSHASGYYCGMTVYPISKLTPERVSSIIREHGSERMIVNGSADWGVSDPLSLVKVVRFMASDGHDPATVKALVFDNAMRFYSGSPRWNPELDIEPLDPREFQR